MESLKQSRTAVVDVARADAYPQPIELVEESGVDVPSLIRVLWRHKWLILVAILVPGIIGVGVALKIPSVYQARATVLIDARGGSNVVDIESVTQGLPILRNLEQVVNSELKVLTSQNLSDRVISSVGLANVSEFNQALLGESGAFSPLSILQSALRRSNADEVDRALTPEERAEKVRVAVLERYHSTLNVVPVARSFAISLRFESQDPVLAANVVNTLADSYISSQVDSKTEETQRASAWLEGRVDDLRLEVREAENAIESYRAEKGLIRASSTTVVEQQLSELNSQLIIARAALAEREAVVRQILRLVETGKIQLVAGVLDSSIVSDLKVEEADLARRAAELRTEYGPLHPVLLNVSAELTEVRTRIEGETARLVETAQAQARVAGARLAALEGDVRRLQGDAGVVNQSEVRLRSLEREATAARTLLETFLTRFKETQDQEGLQQADARVVSYAEVPTDPSKPNRKLIVAVALVIGGGLALLIVAVVEQFDRGLRSSDQVQSQLGLPSLGLVPALPRRVVQRQGPSQYVLDRPTSSFAESLRTLRTGLLLSNRTDPPKTVLFTSAMPGEGKTTTAVALAQLAAFNGERVLLIDCDNRRPSVHKQLEVQNEPGLVEYLEHQGANLFDLLRTTEGSRLHFITAGRAIANSADLLRSEQFAYFLEQMRARYDLVVLDSAPVLAVAEPRVLASMCDATVFVTKWSDTRRETVQSGIQQIAEAGSHIAGVVLTQVNVKKHAAYAFSDSGNYYGVQGSYYTD